MAKIGDIDKNLKVKSKIEKDNLVMLNPNEKPFSIFGVFFENGYKRMDTKIAEQTSTGVLHLHTNTSGGRVTFETDSPYVAISVKGEKTLFPHMPLTGTAGFDLYLYEDGELTYWRSFVPPTDKKKSWESVVEFADRKTRKILIHFPLYSNVNALYIGFDKDSTVNEFSPYTSDAPVVYYGSSITQGGCASRPGNNFPAIVSQKTLTDFLCLGFSGNAHGEEIMADYIASLPMSAFVLDYDHNDSYNPDRLREKHYPFYKKVRDTHPEIPIIIMTAPYSYSNEKQLEISAEIVKETYEKAAKTDKNVFFIDGHKMFGDEYKGAATVDGCHPNDFGFVKMAEAVLKVFEEIKK